MKASWLLWLILGPITGPLAGFCVYYWRRKQPVRAAICGLGIVLFWLFGPAILMAEVSFITHTAHH